MDVEPESETKRVSPPRGAFWDSLRDPRPPTEEQALALVLRAGGATLEDVATELGVKNSTAARLVRLGMEALGVRSHADLIVALGGRRNLPELPDVLTRAEREVVTLLLMGSSNREIATSRGTSVRTVANQLQAIYDKTTVGSRRELVAMLFGFPLQKA